MATPTAASRVVMELQDGRRFSTAWSNHSATPDGLPLAHFFSGKLIARIVGTEDYLTDQEIALITEEITPTPSGEKYPRIILHQRLPKETPKGRRIVSGVASIVQRTPELSLERLDSIIDTPDKSWDGWNDATVYSDGEFQVVVGDKRGDTDCVVHVSTVDTVIGAEAPAPIEDRRRVSGQKADHRRSVPNTVPDFLERLKEYGFEIDDSRRHYGLTHPDRPGVHCPVPRTPSDHRWADNLVAQLKLGFGIDVRQPK